MEDFAENIEDLIPSSNIDKDVVSLSREDYIQIFDKCSDVKNNNIRSRIVVDLIAANGAKKILENFNLIVSDGYALQEISSILSKWDVSELFVGDCRVTVRYSFDDYKPFVPRKHERYGLLGDIFMFVNIRENVVSLQGFLPLESLNRTNADADNYYIEQEELKTFEEVTDYFNKIIPPEDIQELKKERIKIIQYFDGQLEDKIEFFNSLASSKYLRQEMIKFEVGNHYLTKFVEKEVEIKEEVEKDIINISKLADAFIQSKNEILQMADSNKRGMNNPDASSFKLECARANLEKLYMASPSISTEEELNQQESIIETIQNQTPEEVMDSLLENSGEIVIDDKLPMTALLRAFQVFGLLFVIILLTAGIFCFVDDLRYSKADIVTPLKYELKIIKDSVINNVFNR